jgi:hypothetical protein
LWRQIEKTASGAAPSKVCEKVSVIQKMVPSAYFERAICGTLLLFISKYPLEMTFAQ